MDKYMHRHRQQQQQKELADCRRRKPSVEDDRRRSTTSKKMKLNKDIQHVINNDSSNSNSSHGHGSARKIRSPPAEFDPLAVASNAHKIPPPSLPPSPAKVVNWRLACFLAREYLSQGTLLGKPWPAQDSNMTPRENATAQAKKKLRGDEAGSEREAQYSTFTTNFLRSDDIHIPGIFNPSQMAAWLDIK